MQSTEPARPNFDAFPASVASQGRTGYWIIMRGRGSLRTRALAIWAGMLGAVLAASGNYSVAQAQSSGETGDQTALAVPRVGLRGAAGVALPQPLPPSEAALVRRIFSLQAAGSLAEAAARYAASCRMICCSGTILADRYLRGSDRPAPTELAAWLTRYGDQPEAGDIRELLERLSPSAAAPATGAAPAGRTPGATARGARRDRAMFGLCSHAIRTRRRLTPRPRC